ncbi:MAG TPA: mechanosensitive ion channel domain-containing protein [Bellilinea sp.]|nr:mechanosensitive ion channel domain-containing protein [Bellilinea sp.]
MMNNLFLDNRLTAWATGLGFGIGLYLVLMLLRGLCRRHIKTLAERGTVRGAALVQRLLSDLNGIFILAVALWLGSRWLVLSEGAQTTMRIAVLLVVLFQVGLWSVGVVDHVIARRIRREAQEDAGHKTSLNALGVVAKIGVWTLIILVGLDNLPNVNVTSLITGLGIGGIAIGLAVQNILGDLFSSLTIALDKPFVIGDTINVGEFTGSVEHIGLKSTRVRALSGEQLIFANSDLLSSRIRNFKRMEQRRVVFQLRVELDTPTEKLERIPQLLREVIEGQADAAFDRAHFQSITDSGLQFEVVYLIATADYPTFVALQNAINLEIHRRFTEEGIVFARLVGYGKI